MLALVGRPLTRLHRVAFANLVTEEDEVSDRVELPCGHCRELTEREAMELYAAAGAGPASHNAAGARPADVDAAIC